MGLVEEGLAAGPWLSGRLVSRPGKVPVSALVAEARSAVLFESPEEPTWSGVAAL